MLARVAPAKERMAVMRVAPSDLAMAPLILLLSTSALANPCLTAHEARAKWPDARLYWHTENRCWDNHRQRADHYDQPVKLMDSVEKPKSSLERVSNNGPDAEIYYPAVKRADQINDYHSLTWPQPWLSPASILSWPPLIDIDRQPFIPWDKRIGGQ